MQLILVATLPLALRPLVEYEDKGINGGNQITEQASQAPQQILLIARYAKLVQ